MESIGALLDQIAKKPSALSHGDLAQQHPASSSQESQMRKKEQSATRSQDLSEHEDLAVNRQK